MKKTFLIFKITAMIGLLITVIFSIRYFKSESFIEKIESPGSGAAQFFGFDQRTLRWCPQKTKELRLLQANKSLIPRLITDSQLLNRLCTITIEATTIAQAGTPDEYDVVAAVKTSVSKEEKFLKVNRRTKVYNFGGLPFQSKQLDKILSDID